MDINVLMKLKDIINENNSLFEYRGIIVYLITEESDNRAVYRLNIPNNETFKLILSERINQITDETAIYYYPCWTRPDYPNEVSHLSVDEIPNYSMLKDTIMNDENINVVSKKNIYKLAKKSKGYIIRLMYTENKNEDKSMFAFFKMTKSAFLDSAKSMVTFRFDEENGEALKEVKNDLLRFDNRLVCIDIDGHMVISNGSAFEGLLKYDEHITVASELALNEIANKDIIENFDALSSYCQKSKQMKSKLYKIQALGAIDIIGVSDFDRVKQCCGDDLKIDVDNEKQVIRVQDGNIRQSVDHILRVYNNESAETIITRTPIFADKKVLIK